MRFLFVDQILESVPGESICGLKHITADDFYLIPQDTENWYFMPSLIGETLGQLAAWNVMEYYDFSLRPVAGVVSRVHLYHNIYIGESMHLQASIERLDESAVLYSAHASVNGQTVFSLEQALGPLLPMADFIDPEMARAQYQEVYRPADYTEIASHQRPFIRRPVSVCAAPGYDQLLEFTSGESMRMLKKITRQAPFFPDHFPKKPVLPMSILLESALAMARIFIDKSAFPEHWRLKGLQRVKMNEFVFPGECLQTLLQVKQRDEEVMVLSFRTEMRDKRVCLMEAVFENRD